MKVEVTFTLKRVISVKGDSMRDVVEAWESADINDGKNEFVGVSGAVDVKTGDDVYDDFCRAIYLNAIES